MPGPPNSEAEVAMRRQQVLTLLIRGLHPHEISGRLRKSERTIRRDIAAVRAELKKAVNPADLYTAREAYEDMMAVRREQWTLYQTPQPAEGMRDDRYLKSQILQQIQRVNHDLMAMAGLIRARGEPMPESEMENTTRTVTPVPPAATLTQTSTQQGSAVKIQLKREQGIPALQRLEELKAMGIIKGE